MPSTAYQKLSKVPTLFFVKDGPLFLYYNKALIKGGYYFKSKKEGAATFTRKKAEKIVVYLKKAGYLSARKTKIR